MTNRSSPVEELGDLLARDLESDDDRVLVDHLTTHARTIAAWLAAPRPERGDAFEAAPTAFLRERVIRLVHGRNQFAVVGDADAGALDAALHRLFAALAKALEGSETEREDRVRAVLATYRGDVGAFVRLRTGTTPGAVVSASYSPPVQLTVLALDEDSLVDPILDVGCGSEASLVRFLRDLGHDAHGLDRDAPSDVATTGDWLAFDYGDRRWGTVVSHLGFSLHFLHHHLAPGGAAADYARAYLRILRSLREGALFAYAPSLPFFEPHVPAAAYRIERVVFPAPLVTPALREAEKKTGLVLGSATHVRRIA